MYQELDVFCIYFWLFLEICQHLSKDVFKGFTVKVDIIIQVKTDKTSVLVKCRIFPLTRLFQVSCL